jgi:hypothetical protein
MSAQNKAAMAPTIPATPKLLRVRPEAPPLLPELLLEGEEPLEVLVELEGGEEPPVAVLAGELTPVLGGELMLLVPPVRQVLSLLAWTVTISV